MSVEKVRVGVIGCGTISSIYFENGQQFSNLEIVACADLDIERARAKAEQYNLRACTVTELLADESIEIVVNLTIPDAHAEIGLAAILANKSVYNEKPLAIRREEARQMLDAAQDRGVLVGCAPDTFLGGGLQTCRKLLDEGIIGKPVAATAFMLGHGPERWHPNPDFFYQPGAGPMFDMGPYYLTALTTLMGPVRRVTGSAQISFPERMITSQPNYGKTIIVNTPTHIAGVMDFANGAVGTIITSFDVWSHNLPRLEIYGTEGTLSLPDPNTFGGPVIVRQAGANEWNEIALSHGYTGNSRGVGLADMANALRYGRQHRANGELAFHVLDIMHAFHDASSDGTHKELTSTCTRPEPLPVGMIDFQFEEQ